MANSYVLYLSYLLLFFVNPGELLPFESKKQHQRDVVEAECRACGYKTQNAAQLQNHDCQVSWRVYLNIVSSSNIVYTSIIQHPINFYKCHLLIVRSTIT